MMLGFLLARAGVDVVVLEKHADFFRDFRGDTIHPSTLEVIFELGLIEEFLKRPHQEIREVGGQIGDEFIPLADLTHLPTHCKFLGFMPQWDFLDFIKDEAARYPAFHLLMEAEVIGLIEEGNTIVGVRAKTPDGDIEVRATLVVGADGRSSIVRERAGYRSRKFGRADRRVVVSGFAQAKGSRPGARTLCARQDSGDAESRRILAVRVCDSQGWF